MPAGVVTVGRRPYAAGLYWENSPSGRVSQAAKEAARQPGQEAEFYAVRAGSKEGRVPQFGLSPRGAGHKMGLPSFAACLANQQPGSWAGAFRVKEGIVITIVRDELIVPDGDQFYPDETEARERLLQEVGFGGLQRIFAPDSWSVPGADTMPVSLLLNDRADVRLRPIEIPRQFILLGGAAAAALFLLLGIGWFMQERAAKEEAARVEHEQALQRAREAAQKMLPSALQSPEIQYPPPERLWEQRPTPMAIIGACQVALAQVPGVVAGWRMESARCDGSSFNSTWSRQSGFSKLPPQFVIDEKGTGAHLTVSLPSLSPRGHEELLDPDKVTQRYLAQNWPGPLGRAAPDPAPTAPPGFKGEWNPPPPPWVKRSFTVTMPVLPWTLPTFFGALPGTVIEALSFGNGNWTADGVIYENRR